MEYYCDTPDKALFFYSAHDFPRDGFCFPDITALFEATPKLYPIIIDAMARYANNLNFDSVACIESFGYMFGAPLAYKLGKKIVLIRKPHKLPRDVWQVHYDMCYDNNRILEIHQSSVEKDERILVLDDFIASGNTFFATRELIERCCGKVVGGCFVATIPSLIMENKHRFKDEHIYSYCKIVFNNSMHAWEVYTGDKRNELGI